MLANVHFLAVLLALAIWGRPAESTDDPTSLCLAIGRNSSQGCQAFHTCCQLQCAEANFTATCAEERKSLIGTCVCKGEDSSNDTSQPFICGRQVVRPKKPSGNRVVGGEEAKANSWPWQVSMQMGGEHFCGGSLIDARHVVTAGHCVSGMPISPESIKIKVGLHDQEASNSSYQTLSVEKIILHPGYSVGGSMLRGPANDVAVIRLADVVKFNANVTPICLPERDPPPGKLCVTTGWGRTKGTGDNRFLQQVTMPVLDQKVCNDTEHHGGNIDDTMICLFSEGKSGCHGDSGGPMVCERSNGIWELHGVVSWGSATCQDKPSVFNRVVQSKKWIRANIKL